jgi:DnaJ-class molecular chaperone
MTVDGTNERRKNERPSYVTCPECEGLGGCETDHGEGNQKYTLYEPCPKCDDDLVVILGEDTE